MADRFWVLGTGTWNTTTTHWSTTSGGAGGASVPTASDNAIFDNNSGGGTVTLSGTRTCLNFDVKTTWTGAWASGTSPVLNISGDFKDGSGALPAAWSINLIGTGTQSVNNNGLNTGAFHLYDLTINGAGGTFNLTESFGIRNLTLTNGTFNLSTFSFGVSATFALGVGTKTLNTGTGPGLLLGNSATSSAPGWNSNTNVSGFTLSGTAPIIIDNTANVMTFAGGGITTFPDIKIGTPWGGAGSTGAITFQQSNTYNSIQINPGGSIKFQSSTTHTVLTAPAWTGSSGSLITVAAGTSGTFATLSYSGTPAVICDWLSLKDNHASGNTPFYAGHNSTLVSGTLNWQLGTLFTDALTFSVTASYTFTFAVTFAPTLSFDLTASESYSLAVTYNPTLSDSVTATDAAVTAVTFVTSTSDSLTGSDVLSLAVTYSITTADSVISADAVTTTVTFNTNLDDSVTVTDSNGVTTTYNTSYVDAVTATDSNSATVSYLIGYSDTITAGELIDATATFETDFEETIQLDDSFFDELIPGSFRVKYWNGSAWDLKPLKQWAGTEWARDKGKHWDGNSWTKL